MCYCPSTRPRWLDSGQVLFSVFMDQDGGQYPAILTEKASSIKDLLFGFQGSISRRTQRVVLSGQDCSIFPARVANYSMPFVSSCQLTELDIYKIKNFTRIHLEPANSNSVISNSHYFWICPAGIFCSYFKFPGIWNSGVQLYMKFSKNGQV